MEVKVDLTAGTATAIFDNKPTTVAEQYRHFISYDAIGNYRRKGYTVYFAKPEYRDPYVIKEKVIGSDWGEYIANMDELKKQITSAEDMGITVTNKKSFEEVYKRALKQYAQLVEIEKRGNKHKQLTKLLEERQRDNKHKQLVKLLSSQDYETLVTLIETASWHLIDHYEYEQKPIPPTEQAVINIKTKWDTIQKKEG